MRSDATRGVCRRCARRSWLLAQLATALDRTARDPARLWPALALGDEQLIDALGDHQRDALHDAWRRWSQDPSDGGACRSPFGSALCRHHCAYPPRLAADPLAPHALLVDGDISALCRPDDAPLVALVGVPGPSEYALASAGALARDLALAGVAIACADDELGACTSGAALAVGGRAIVVGNDDAGEPAERGRGAIERGACRVAELLPDDPRPAWSRLSHQRILALLADLVIVVETVLSPADGRREPACVELARRRGTRLAAVPDRIDSPRSEGVNTLMLEGAPPVVDAWRLLDMLYGVGKLRRPRRPSRRPLRRARRRGRVGAVQGRATARIRGDQASICEQQSPAPECATVAPALQPRLARVLARVRSGEDTLAKLCAGESACEAFAVALTELELLGALQRAPDGSYLVS
jgi:predicted Rossmann fold nucleotide-binding protein DprA/Smf involved in DNA uptake